MNKFNIDDLAYNEEHGIAVVVNIDENNPLVTLQWVIEDDRRNFIYPTNGIIPLKQWMVGMYHIAVAGNDAIGALMNLFNNDNENIAYESPITKSIIINVLSTFESRILNLTRNQKVPSGFYQHMLNLLYDQLPVYFTTYHVTREYGGPEEGGWFYTNYEKDESIKCVNYIAALLMDHASRIDKPKPISYYIELFEGQHETVERPYYS